MNPLDGLAYGFGVALTPENLIAALVGALIGTAVGILPGMSPTVAIALLLTPTMNMRPETGIIMLGAIYYGTQYGDSMTAILLGVPSEAPSMVIGIDGYQMSKKGRAGTALAVSAVGSFIGASVGLIGLALFASILSRFALAFGPPEFFAVAFVGLIVLIRMVSGASIWKGVLALCLGLGLKTIGVDPMSSQPRFTFGSTDLLLGVELIPVVMGLVGMAEMFDIAAGGEGLPKVGRVRFRELFPSKREWADAIPASLRGAGLGFLFGLVPGPAVTLATFASYRVEKRLAPEEVGRGSPRAVAGPKSADDGAVSGTLVPLMALGIPFTSVTAMLLAGLLLHGVEPGPVLMLHNPEVFWGLVAAMYIGNVALLVMNFPLVGMWMSLLRVPQPILLALLVCLMLIGSFAVRSSVLDMFVVLIAGGVGYVMKKLHFDRTLVILGMVIGPMLEENFGPSLELSGGDPRIFITSTIPQVLLAALVVVLAGPAIFRRLTGKRLVAPVELGHGAGPTDAAP